MTAIIDTSSLLSFVRYYLPFDSKGVLRGFLVDQVRQGAIVILDAVWEECQYVAKGIVAQELPELQEFVKDTSSLFPSSQRKLSNLLDGNFCNGIEKKMLTEEEFASYKQEFMKSADYKIIVTCMQHPTMFDADRCVITEETAIGNDGKVFKKLPAIMKILDIPVFTVSQFFRNNGIEAEWYLREAAQ